MEAAAASASKIGSRTIADLLPRSVERFDHDRAILSKAESGQWVSRTYTEVGETVRELALGLIDLGIEKGDKVSILANTRPEWTYADFAALSVGATVVPIYQTNSPEECQYVLENSDAKLVIVEDEDQLEKIRKVRGECPELRHVVRMTGSSDDAISLEDLAERGRGRDAAEWRERYDSVGPDDLCTIIYTSGTTGPPKGCMISHGNYRAMLDMALENGVLEQGELTYLFLPLAHSFALLIQLISFEVGGALAYWERDPLKIVPNLSEVRPTYFPSVPRIFEKIYTAATSAIEKEGGPKKKIFWWGIGVGKQVRQAEREGRSPNPLVKAQHALADRLVLSKIRDLFGGNLKTALTGAAPINPEILEFFDAAGILVLEGWGMTETSTAACVATPDEFKFGTVGRPFNQVEVRIADDGEILVRGPNVFQGYYKMPEETAETIRDGWLHTGDLGEIDEDGFLDITGRKKDIIITAGGKNITPANIEAEIKQHPYVSQCVLVGDQRPFLVALVTLDPEEMEKAATEDPELGDAPESWAQSQKVHDAIWRHVEEVNHKYARVEQVKKIRILEQDLSQEGGELTPTLKVKRNVVVDKHSDAIEELYA